MLGNILAAFLYALALIGTVLLDTTTGTDETCTEVQPMTRVELLLFYVLPILGCVSLGWLCHRFI